MRTQLKLMMVALAVVLIPAAASAQTIKNRGDPRIHRADRIPDPGHGRFGGVGLQGSLRFGLAAGRAQDRVSAGGFHLH